MIERVTHGQVADGFGARVEHGITSLFDRMGFKEPDGTPIRVTSHQFRHLLNTMAQKGGATQFDIARWSGRKDFSQNTAYDHESAGELLARVQAMVCDDTGIFGLPAEIRINEPKTREEYGRMVAPAHRTCRRRHRYRQHPKPRRHYTRSEPRCRNAGLYEQCVSCRTIGLRGRLRLVHARAHIRERIPRLLHQNQTS